MTTLKLGIFLHFVNNIKLVLDIFSDSLFVANQEFNFSSSKFNVDAILPMLLSEKNMFVSSAKRINFNFSDILQRSFIYSRNNFGPNIDP